MNTFKRVLLKLSGESLMGAQQYGIDTDRLGDYARDQARAHGIRDLRPSEISEMAAR